MTFDPEAEVHYARNGELTPLELSSYPDGTPLIRKTPQEIDAILLRPKTLQAFFTTMFWVDALAERSWPIPPLVLPCLPGARQDRLNDSGDFLFTAKSFAREINLRKFPQVLTLDPHSEVMPGLIDRCEVIPASDVFLAHPSFIDAVVSPDAGAEKRAGAIAKSWGKPLIHAWKTRSLKDGSLSGFGIESLDDIGDQLGYEPNTYGLFVADDICDGGGTFVGLIGAIDAHYSFEAHLYVTHGFFYNGTDLLFSHYKNILCTDSVIADRPGVTVLPFVEQMTLAAAIAFAHKG